MSNEMGKVSVVIPCYFSAETIGKVVNGAKDELTSYGCDFEFILVNDGSTDNTFEVITSLADSDSQIIGIDLSKNFGQHSAIMAGLHEATGDYILLLDDDMQTHPSQIKKLLKAAPEHDVVFAEWEQHKEALWRRLGSKFTDWSMCVLAKQPKDVYASNFLIMKRFVAEEMCKYEGPYVYIQGLIFKATSDAVNVTVEHFDRESGSSGYTLRSLIRLWMTILNFSMVPLRAASLIGMLLGLLGFAGAIFIFVQKLVDPSMQIGWSSTMVTILICSGAIITFLGIIGEYIGRLFMTANHSPQFVMKKIIGKKLTENLSASTGSETGQA